MPKPVLWGLIAAVAALAIAIGVAAAGLSFGSDEEDPPNASSGVSHATPVAPTPVTNSATAVLTMDLEVLLRQLPAVIRDRLRDQYTRGEITLDAIYAMVDTRQAAARFGVIQEIEAGKIEIRTPEGEDYSWEITSATAIKAINRPGTVADLHVGDSVFILSRDGGKTAFSIDNYGVLAQ